MADNEQLEGRECDPNSPADNATTALDCTGTQDSFSAGGKKIVKLTVRGQPVPLRRHRTSRGYTYNPSATAQEAFREVVSGMIPAPPIHTGAGSSFSADPVRPRAFFHENEHLAVALVFRMRRPKSHFVGGRPGPGRLRPTSPGLLHPIRTDVDNLAKFVLDSLNGLLYVDDRQVVSLQATKVLDTDGCCEGATEITIRNLCEEELDSLVTGAV